MSLRLKPHLGRSLITRRLITRAGIALVAIATTNLLVPHARAQQRTSGDSSSQSSELTLRNMSRVAASPAELKTILVEDTGLMVEVERWIAKDASAHGQIVSDGDLTTDAIFARLETDVQFRSAVTVLVQRYGYLVPKLNPESDAAKEQLLLVQERTKWIAQAEEEERVQGRRPPATGQSASQNGAARDASQPRCDPQSTQSCNGPQSRPSAEPREESPAELPPPILAPGNPASPGGNADTRTMLTDMQLTDMQRTPESLPFSGPYDTTTLTNGSSLNSASSSRNEFSFLGEQEGESSLASRYAAALNQGSGGGGSMALGDLGSGSGMLPDVTEPDSTPGGVMAGNSLTRLQTGRPRLNSAILQPVEMIRKRSPYADIPSLYDMYIQAVPRPSTPQRFGAAVFENGTRDLQWMPMDLPAGPDYVVGPGDGLTVSLWGGVSQRLQRTVDREGRISLPEVGPILVSGESLSDLQQSLQQVLRSQFRDVSADVSLSRLRTIRIYEVGDVANAGAYDISSLSTPLNALFVAGGPTALGSMRILKHYRGDQLVQVVDVYDLLLHGVKANLQRLENGDTVLVPPIGSQVTVEGMVRRPAVYELKDEKTLADVLDLAGGLLPAATLRHVEVQRTVAHDKQTMLSLDIPETVGDAEVTKKLESFEIHDGDQIRIFPIAAYNQDAVYVEGHVVRPGKYSFHENMRVTDVVSSYKDLLPEPSTQYAEIIRLNAAGLSTERRKLRSGQRFGESFTSTGPPPTRYSPDF